MKPRCNARGILCRPACRARSGRWTCGIPATPRRIWWRARDGPAWAGAAGGQSVAFALSLEVLPLRLPPPREWSFHLDLWQNPFAVARYHHVRPWSPEHFALLRPHLKMLADAGAKCLTTIIIHDPWGGQ